MKADKEINNLSITDEEFNRMIKELEEYEFKITDEDMKELEKLTIKDFNVSITDEEINNLMEELKNIKF